MSSYFIQKFLIGFVEAEKFALYRHSSENINVHLTIRKAFSIVIIVKTLSLSLKYPLLITYYVLVKCEFLGSHTIDLKKSNYKRKIISLVLKYVYVIFFQAVQMYIDP